MSQASRSPLLLILSRCRAAHRCIADLEADRRQHRSAPGSYDGSSSALASIFYHLRLGETLLVLLSFSPLLPFFSPSRLLYFSQSLVLPSSLPSPPLPSPGIAWHDRYQLYQLIGAAASQKVLFVHPAHDTLCGGILSSLSFTDNKFMTQLLKYFVEPYALNAHPHMAQKTAGAPSS